MTTMTMTTMTNEDSVFEGLAILHQMEESEMAGAHCPECDAVIAISDPRLGAMITCPCCNVKLEVYDTDPLDVYFPFDEIWDDKDWDADRDEEDQTQ
jgi:lysine biosynthesis protein LysW